MGQSTVLSFPPGLLCQWHPVDFFFHGMAAGSTGIGGNNWCIRLFCDRDHHGQFNSAQQVVLRHPGGVACKARCVVGIRRKCFQSCYTQHRTILRGSRDPSRWRRTEHETDELHCHLSRCRQYVFWKGKRKRGPGEGPRGSGTSARVKACVSPLLRLCHSRRSAGTSVTEGEEGRRNSGADAEESRRPQEPAGPGRAEKACG